MEIFRIVSLPCLELEFARIWNKNKNGNVNAKPKIYIGVSDIDANKSFKVYKIVP